MESITLTVSSVKELREKMNAFHVLFGVTPTVLVSGYFYNSVNDLVCLDRMYYRLVELEGYKFLRIEDPEYRTPFLVKITETVNVKFTRK